LKLRLTFACLLLSFLLLPASATADSGALGRIGDSVQPLEHTQVKMVSKDITAEVNTSHTYFEAVFTFYNDGPETAVLMGFPEATGLDGDPPEELPERRFHQDLEDFKAYVNGEKVETEKEDGLLRDNGLNAVDFPNWYTWKVDFAEEEIVEVKNTYKAPNSVEGGFLTSTGYIKSTGATWQGSIGEARITFKLQDLSPHQLIFAVPPGFKIEDGNLVWEWEDLDPHHNIEMSFNTCLSGQIREYHLSEKTIDTWDSWNEKLSAGSYGSILSEAERILNETSGEDSEQYYLSAAYRCLAHEKLGDTKRAIATWEQLLENLGTPEQMVEPLKGYFYNKAHFRLAKLYHETGQTGALEELYQQLFEAPPNAPLKRLIESFLPPEKVRRSDPVINRTAIDENRLILEAEDPGGDLAAVQFMLWEEKNGEKKLIAEQELPAYAAYFSYFYYNLTPGMVYDPAALYKLEMSYELERLFPGLKDLDLEGNYYYAVEVSDFAGNRDTTEKRALDTAFLLEDEVEPDPEEDPEPEPAEEASAEEDQKVHGQAEKDQDQQPVVFLAYMIPFAVAAAAIYLVRRRTDA